MPRSCLRNSRESTRAIPWGSTALLLLMGLCACGRSDRQPSSPDPYVPSDSSHDPGNPSPTNDRSMNLMDDDPELRRLRFKGLMDDAKKKCDVVTEAVLKGGFEGMDVWRVTCGDTRDWLVTFRPNEQPVVESCSQSNHDCRAPWSSVSP